MNDITFASPYLLWLLLIVPLLTAWYFLNQNKTQATIQISNLGILTKIAGTWKTYLRHLLFVLRMLAVILLIFALARPQSTDELESISTEGIDIMLTLDVSTSMLARDFKPNRIEAAKNLANEFIRNRQNDRIGLVAFAGESFTQCPLTTDLNVVINLMNELKTGVINDGTAIGLGLSTAINRIKDSQTKSKIIILLTDGVNNSGSISPTTAAELAKTFNIRIYTIGVGSMGTAPYPFQTPFGMQMKNIPVEIDENTLRKIASETKGEYFRATSNTKLKQIYEQIDKLEKTKIEVNEYTKKKEEFLLLTIIAGIFIVTEILLKTTVLRSLP